MLSTKYRKLFRSLVQRIKDDRAKIEKLEQVVEAFGDDNRLFTVLAEGEPVTEHKALNHYFGNGGPVVYRQKHQRLRKRSA